MEIRLFKSLITSEKRCLGYPESNIILRHIQVELDREKKKIYRDSLADSLQALVFIIIEKW